MISTDQVISWWIFKFSTFARGFGLVYEDVYTIYPKGVRFETFSQWLPRCAWMYEPKAESLGSGNQSKGFIWNSSCMRAPSHTSTARTNHPQHGLKHVETYWSWCNRKMTKTQNSALGWSWRLVSELKYLNVQPGKASSNVNSLIGITPPLPRTISCVLQLLIKLTWLNSDVFVTMMNVGEWVNEPMV